MPRLPWTRLLSAIPVGLLLGLGAVASPPTTSTEPPPPVQKTQAGKFAPFDLTYLPGFGPQGILGFRPAEIGRGLPPNKAVTELQVTLRQFLELFLGKCFDGDLKTAEIPRFEDFEECILGVSVFSNFDVSLTAGLCSPGVLRTTKPFDWAGAIQKWFPRAEKQNWAGKDYFRLPWQILLVGKEPGYLGIFVPDEHTVVFGDEAPVRKLLDRLQAGKQGRPPPPGWKEYERETWSRLGFDTRTSPCVKGQWPEGSRELQHVRTLVEGVRVLAAGVSVGDRTEVRFTALARDCGAARNAVESTRQLLTKARQGLAGGRQEGVLFQAVKLLGDALEKVEIVRAGRRVRVRIGAECNVLGMLGAALLNGSQPPPGTSSVETIDNQTPAVSAVNEVKHALVTVRGVEPAEQAKEENNRPGTALGVIVDPNGLLLVPYEKLQKETALEVVLADGSIFPAKTIQVDAKRGVAILKVEAGKSLFPARFADSDPVAIGDTVIALGWVPGCYGRTVVMGIVSAHYKMHPDGEKGFLIDHALSPGLGSGLLIDLQGNLIGLIPRGGNPALAVSSNRLKEMVTNLSQIPMVK